MTTYDVVFAEGLPTESYLDAGDRGNFGNSGVPVVLYPDFSSRIHEAEGCAPLVVTGSKLDKARQATEPFQGDWIADGFASASKTPSSYP